MAEARLLFFFIFVRVAFYVPDFILLPLGEKNKQNIKQRGYSMKIFCF